MPAIRDPSYVTSFLDGSHNEAIALPCDGTAHNRVETLGDKQSVSEAATTTMRAARASSSAQPLPKEVAAKSSSGGLMTAYRIDLTSAG